MADYVYKILPACDWRPEGPVIPAAIDLKDGYIHLSTLQQLPGTLKLFFEGVEGLKIVALETDKLNREELKWEKSTNPPQVFPHYYGDFPKHAVAFTVDLKIGRDCIHDLSPVHSLAAKKSS